MRRKLIALVLVAAAASGAAFVGAGARPNGAQPPAPAAAGGREKPKPPADEPGMIDGAKNPELIPDRVAYSLLFRVISGRQNEADRERVRSYVRQFGTGVKGCDDNKDCSKRMSNADVDAILAAAAEYQGRVAALDQQAGEIKKNNWSNRTPEIMAQLTQLQRQKDAVIDEFVASMPKRLSPGGLKRLRDHVEGRVKVKTKIKKHAAGDPGMLLGSLR